MVLIFCISHITLSLRSVRLHLGTFLLWGHWIGTLLKNSTISYFGNLVSYYPDLEVIDLSNSQSWFQINAYWISIADWLTTKSASFAIHISLFLLHWKFLISKTCFSLIFPITSFRFWIRQQVFGKLENIIFRNFQRNTNTWQLHCSLMVIYCYATVPW